MLCRIHAQRQCRQAVGHQVDPQDQDRRERVAYIEDGGDKNQQHLPHIGREQELNGFQNIVVDTTPLLHCPDDGSEVIVGEDHIGGILRHLRTHDTHRYTYIGLLECRRIVHPVTGHRHYLTLRLPCFYDTHLVLGCNTGVDGVILYITVERLIGHLHQIGAGYSLVALLVDPYLLSDSHSCHLMITGDHHRTDAGSLALLHRLHYLGTCRIDQPEQADKDKLLLHCFCTHLSGEGIYIFISCREHTQG